MPNYHSHILTSNHSHIIGRTDPITGDRVKENDRVVFCAACKSCFLEESWLYMGGRHCEQETTLKELPKLSSALNIRNRNNEIIAELRDETFNTHVIATTFFTFVFSMIALGTLDTAFASDMGASFIVASFLAVFAALLSSIIVSQKKIKRFLKSEANDIRLFVNRIKVGKDTYFLKDIKQIKFQREMEYFVAGNPSKVPTLFLYFYNGKRVTKNFPTKDYKSVEGLAKISKFTEVYFYSEQSQEHIVIKRIRDKTKGSIIVGEPHILLGDSNYPNQF